MTRSQTAKNEKMRNTPEWKVAKGEAERLLKTAERLVERRQSELCAILTTSEQREAFDRFVKSIEMSTRLLGVCQLIGQEPCGINTPEFKELISGCSEFLSQQG